MKSDVRFVFVLLFVAAFGVSCGYREYVRKSMHNAYTTEVSPPQTNEESLAVESADDTLQFCGGWDVGDKGPLKYRVVKSQEREQFVVTDALGKVLFEAKFAQVNKIYTVWALRTDIPQLVIEFGEGGQDSFVQMLNYEGGRIGKIINEANGSNSFGAGMIIQPQFQTGANPAKVPFEILLTDHGLNSPSGKFTRVLRYKNGEYIVVGKFDRGKVADFKEEVLVPQ